MEHVKPYLRWAAVAVAVVALAFAYLAPHRTDQVATPEDSPPPAPVQTTAAQAADAVASPLPTNAPTSLAVYVCGAIRHTGVFKLAPGSRVVDAVNDAGGLSSDADAEAVNLAQPVVDGMKIDVPKKGEHIVVDALDTGAGSAGASFASASTSSHHTSRHRSSGRSGASKLQPGETLDINTASESDLERLPGVGPSLARRIIEYREANGPFATADDLQNVSGIGPSKFAKMEPYIRLYRTRPNNWPFEKTR